MSSIQRCDICNDVSLDIVFDGPIRLGKFGQLTSKNVAVYACPECGLGRSGHVDLDLDSFYASNDYRAALGVEGSLESHRKAHDPDLELKLKKIRLHGLRGKRILDVGCGGGSFLNICTGIASDACGVEPNDRFRHALQEENLKVYSSLAEAAQQSGESFDVVTSFNVIEHVVDFREFLDGMVSVLKPGGTLYLETPNFNDVLMTMGPASFKQFFFRIQHYWYFSARALELSLKRAGLTSIRVENFHTYGIENFLAWFTRQAPTGRMGPCLDETLNFAWTQYVEKSGQGDRLFATAIKP